MVIKVKDIIPPTLEHQLATLGHNLKTARKRRKWSVEKVRKDVKCSKGTLENAEKGKPTVCMGVYVLLLELYGFKFDLASLTNPTHDLVGQSLSGEHGNSRAKPKISAADF